MVGKNVDKVSVALPGLTVKSKAGAKVVMESAALPGELLTGLPAVGCCPVIVKLADPGITTLGVSIVGCCPVNDRLADPGITTLGVSIVGN